MVRIRWPALYLGRIGWGYLRCQILFSASDQDNTFSCGFLVVEERHAWSCVTDVSGFVFDALVLNLEALSDSGAQHIQRGFAWIVFLDTQNTRSMLATRYVLSAPFPNRSFKPLQS